MKNFFLGALLACIIVNACSKEPLFNKNFAGLYVCSSATMDSGMMDLNDDGAQSNDILEELSQYFNIDMIKEDCGCIVYNCLEGKNSRISLCVPVQSLYFGNNSASIELVNALAPWVSISYSILNDTSFEVGAVDYSGIDDVVMDQDSGYPLNLHLKNIKLIDIKADAPGKITAQINLDYYDFLSGKMITKSITMKYTRVKKT